MIVLIAGPSHTGKTALAQRLLETLRYPYLSIDLLKMGLIRSGRTRLTPLSSDRGLTELLWPVAREMVKTAIENGQDLIVEGCYIPFDWAKDFSEKHLAHIRYRCLVMSEGYIRAHYGDILAHACDAERRASDDCTLEGLLRDNALALDACREHGAEYILIDQDYSVDF